MSRRTRYALAVGLVVGIVIAVATGWLIAVVLAPAAAAGLPFLLSAPGSKTRVERLEALEEWSRSLAGVLVTGQTLRSALIKSARTAPAPIHTEVATLAARLRSNTSLDEALMGFADDVDDATGDLVAVLLAATGEQPGRAAVLEAIAESTSDDVRARRRIEADQNKPRTTARVITAFTIGVLGFFSLSGRYIEPYRTPIGQVILGLLLAAYVAALLWMRSMATGKPLPRFLGASSDALGEKQAVSKP